MATYQINVTKEKKQENVVNLTYKIIKRKLCNSYISCSNSNCNYNINSTSYQK